MIHIATHIFASAPNNLQKQVRSSSNDLIYLDQYFLLMNDPFTVANPTAKFLFRVLPTQL